MHHCIVWLHAVVFLLSYPSHVTAVSNAVLNPVILVPGLGGSQIEARLNKTKGLLLCALKSDWYQLWLSIEQLTLSAHCMVDNMKLRYNREKHKTENQDGVETRFPGFGNTSSVEWLDQWHPLLKTELSYFYYIVDYLQTHMNYTRGVSIRGAPFDFRKAPNEMEDYLSSLTKLIEETHIMNGYQKVVLLGHSMGNNYIQYLLSKKTRHWKDRYIKKWISLSAPWTGSVKSLKLMASGDSLGQMKYVIEPLEARPLEKSLASTAWMMPSDTHWKADEVLVYGPSANYTVDKYREFFDAIEYPDGYLMRKDTEYLTKDMKAPGVELHCLYGVGVKTPDSLDYRYVRDETNKRWFDNQPKLIYGDGDGTVNFRSLDACRTWTNEQSVYIRNFTTMGEHLEMLRNKDVHAYIAKVLQN